jgi:hypothetical protein
MIGNRASARLAFKYFLGVMSKAGSESMVLWG